MAVQGNAAGGGVVKARDEVGDSALARAAAPDNREGAAGRDVDVQVADDRSAAVITETDVLVAEFSARPLDRYRAGLFFDSLKACR